MFRTNIFFLPVPVTESKSKPKNWQQMTKEWNRKHFEKEEREKRKKNRKFRHCNSYARTHHTNSGQFCNFPIHLFLVKSNTTDVQQKSTMLFTFIMSFSYHWNRMMKKINSEFGLFIIDWRLLSRNWWDRASFLLMAILF